MKTVSILTVAYLFLLSSGCSEDSSVGPEENPPTAIASATIGPDGGDLEHERFRLHVPAGAFETVSTVELFVSDESAPFGESAVSDLFYLEGLPDHWDQPLGVEVAYNGELSGESFIAFGQESFVISAGVTDVVYRLLPASESRVHSRSTGQSFDVRLIATDIPPLEQTDSPHHVGAVSQMASVVSPPGHFKIIYPTAHTTIEEAIRIGGYMEEAYTKFGRPGGIGFAYDARTLWPAEVHIRKLAADIDGRHEASMWGVDYDQITLNQTKVYDAATMRLTSGHEFFHLVQMLYDPRFSYWRAKTGGPNLWLEEACSVWSEELFTEETDYVSESREDSEMQPFRGLQAGVSIGPRIHGYGMSSLIDHLVDTDSTSILVEFFQATQQEMPPAEAILSTISRPVESWLPAFFRAYLLGNHYGDNLSLFIEALSDRTKIETEQDEVAHFRSSDSRTGPYPDLSAKLFLVELRDPGLDSRTSLRVSATAAGVQPWVGLFEYERSGLTYIVGREGRAIADDLGTIRERDNHILICVVNPGYHHPDYTGSTSIDTEVRVIRSGAPTWESFDFGMRIDATLVDQDQNVIAVADMYFEGRGNGSFTDYEFAGDWYAPYDWGTMEGAIYVVLDPTLSYAETVTVVGTTDYHNGRTDDWSVLANDVPFSHESDELAYFVATGLSTCDQIDDVGFETYYGETVQSLAAWHCTVNSEIRVSFGPRQ